MLWKSLLPRQGSCLHASDNINLGVSEECFCLLIFNRFVVEHENMVSKANIACNGGTLEYLGLQESIFFEPKLALDGWPSK